MQVLHTVDCIAFNIFPINVGTFIYFTYFYWYLKKYDARFMLDTRNETTTLLKIGKKSHEVINIYYISYIMIKKVSYCENIQSVNLLYLIIHFATGHFKEKYGEKYLIINSTEKYEDIFSGIKSKIEILNSVKELLCEKVYTSIGINTDDDLPLNKHIKFPKLTIVIRCVLYLDECLYEL